MLFNIHGSLPPNSVAMNPSKHAQQGHGADPLSWRDTDLMAGPLGS